MKSKNTFFYLGMLLITFDIFPFQKYGLGSGKSLSIVPLILYLLQNAKMILRPIEKNFKELFLIVLLLSVSCYMGLTHYLDMDGWMQSISMWGTYVVIMLSFAIFMRTATFYDVRKMLIFINRSFTISLFFGIIEFFSYEIHTISFAERFISLFVRDSMYMAIGRLQFNFGEPSSAGLMLCCLYIPTLYLLKRFRYKFTKFDIIKSILLFLLTYYTMSTTFYMQLGILVIIWGVYKTYKHWNIKRLLSLGILFVILVPLWVRFFSSYNNGRIYKIITAPQQVAESEASTGTRIGLWLVSLYSFKDNPLLGWGWGYFSYAFKANFNKIPIIIYGDEFYDKVNKKGHQSYSLYSTAFVEGGCLGMLWLLFFLRKRQRSTSDELKPFFFSYLCALVQVIPIYSVPYMFCLYIVSDSKINKFLSTDLSK